MDKSLWHDLFTTVMSNLKIGHGHNGHKGSNGHFIRFYVFMRMHVRIKSVALERKIGGKNQSRYEFFILKGVVLGRYISKFGWQGKKVRFWTFSIKVQNFKCRVESPFFTKIYLGKSTSGRNTGGLMFLVTLSKFVINMTYLTLSTVWTKI